MIQSPNILPPAVILPHDLFRMPRIDHADSMPDLYKLAHDLLQNIGAGKKISRSAYDTAWVARLAEIGQPIGEEAIEWLRAHQLTDGSWGTNAPQYYHDRLVCTLSAMIALANRGETRDRNRLRRARATVNTAIKRLRFDRAGETIGFEMILPTLLAQAVELDLIEYNGNGLLSQLVARREAKLASLPTGMINRSVTVAFSAEMIGADNLHLLDQENLQEANGSVACSPSATAFFARYGGQPEQALNYLNDMHHQGAVPVVGPINIFEISWSLWNLSLTNLLDDRLRALCKPHLDFLEEEWTPGQGIGPCSGLNSLDGDDTGLTYEILNRFGRSVDIDAVLNYETDEYFRCYPLEANPSVSTNIHILGALREAGYEAEHPSVQKVITFLQTVQEKQQFWYDKWHTSPYYPTTHAVIVGAGYCNNLVANAVNWIVNTQNEDGSWGTYMPTAEETAYCLQALAIWKQFGGYVPQETLEQGQKWLLQNIKGPYPSLWIGKSLYCPELVVYSSILSALALAAR